MGTEMTTTDRIKATGVSPDAMLQVTQLCNSVRLAADSAELREAEAKASSFVTSLRVGGGISEHQKEQLVGLFGDLAALTNAQLAATMTDTNTAEPDFALENQAFERAAAEMSFQLDKLPGGFYVSQPTQRAWALWIRRAAIAGAEVLAALRTQKIGRLESFIQEQLADTIRDLARQDHPYFRGQYYGECRGMLKVLRLGEMLDEAQRDQWSADIYRASLQAADQCATSGQAVDEAEVSKQRYQLERLAERGITPRAELPR